MFKLNLIHKLVLLAIPMMGVAVTSGCADMSSNNRMQMHDGYAYHSSNGRVYYQDSNGRYYVQGKDGRYYYKKYYVTKHHHRYYRYYRYYPDGNGHYIKNSSLSTHVRYALLNDPALKDQMITVKTNNKGSVELMGVVQSTYQKERAVSLTLGVPGVRYVDDDLAVKGS